MTTKKLYLLLVFLLAPIYAFSNVHYDIVIDRAGRGDFRSIQQAIDSLEIMKHDKQILVYIRNGYYKEKLHLPKEITNIKFIGEDKNKTIINYDDHANINAMGTFKTYTIKISGNNLLFENLTFENTAHPMGQAVAVHVEGDKIIFRNCRFIGNQDTLYTGEVGSRQYYENCYIEGTTDFIFGPATAYFNNCTIHAKYSSYITAANTPMEQKYGLIFNNCKVTTAPDVTYTFLGRPWRPYSMTLFMNCILDNGIQPKGWDNWRKESNELTARYMEYNNTGEGSNTSQRVKWSKQLSSTQAKQYSLENVMKGNDEWNPLNQNDLAK